MSLNRSDADRLSLVLSIILRDYNIESFLLLTISKQESGENAVLGMVGKSLTNDGKTALTNLTKVVEVAMSALGAEVAESGFNYHEKPPASEVKGDSSLQPKKSRLDPSPN